VVRGVYGDGSGTPCARVLAGLAAMCVVVVWSASPALALSARDLAGTGEGFRDFDLGASDPTASGAVSGGVLGGLAAPSAAAPEVRLNPVPSGTDARDTLPTLPRLHTPVSPAVPTPRLRPVVDSLQAVDPAPALAPSVSSPAPETPPAAAPPDTAPTDPATLIRADELRYERDLGLYRARGNVELTNGERVVMADAVSYNERTDTLTANGNVRVVEADGTTYFANYVELSADFRDGFVRDMSVLLADRSRITAVYATRTAGERKDFWKGVYTACDTCPTDEGSPWPTLSGNQAGTRERQRPLWQIRAAHVTHDEVARDIIYRDATLELFGVPVAYTPYLTQPDPTVYRRTGVLAPTFGVDDTMGYWTEVPYYVVIDDQQDTTLRVRAMSEEAWLLHPEYRLRFGSGELYLDGSLTNDGAEGLSGHLTSRGRWHINDVWRAGFDSAVATFDGYLDRYDFPNPDWLTNHAYVEAFSGRNYAAAEAFSFDDTRVDYDDDANPIVLPLVTYDYASEPVMLGGRMALNGSVQGIHREDGASSTRVSGSVGWTRAGTLNGGLAYDVNAFLNSDLYVVDDANQTDGVPGSGYDGSVARVYPSARMRLRYPMVRVAPNHRQILEPIVTVAMAPPDLNTKRIPNEDSQDPQLTHVNLFTGDRTGGRDRVDDGLSVNYGLRWTYLDADNGSVAVQFGQAWRPFESDFLLSSAGYGQGLSDFVGSLDVRPHPYLDLFYHFRLDRDDLTPNRTVLGFRAGPPVLSIGGTYVRVGEAGDVYDSGIPDREEVVASVNTAFSRYWSAYAGGRYNLARNQTVDLWGGLTYEDECLALALDYTSNYNEVSGEDEGQSLVLRMTLKTLGEISF